MGNFIRYKAGIGDIILFLVGLALTSLSSLPTLGFPTLRVRFHIGWGGE